MRRRQFLTGTAALGAAATFAGPTAAEAAPPDTLPTRAEIVEVMNRVDNYWIGTHANPGGTDWARATYFSGLLHHYRLTREQRLLDYGIAWGNQNSWSIPGGVTTRNADNHCAGQAYLDMFEEVGGANKIAMVESSVSRMLTDQPDKNDDWWWCDTLHMAMPVFARFGKLRGNNLYWVKLYRLYHYSKRMHGGAASYYKPGNQSESSAFWYRDQRFQVDGEAAVSPNGKPVHWSRGNGWVMGAYAKTLKVIPHTDKRGPEYLYGLRQLAAELRTVQQADGFWYPNLSDPQHFGGPETSGTAFFAFGIAYGIRAGLLDRATYLPVVARAWNGMVATAVRSDGFLGYCQPGGDRPAAAPATRTEDFGVGAFLMAGSEIAGLTS